MVGGSEHHSLYANRRQYPSKEQPVLRFRVVHLPTRKQQLSLPCGAATELWWPQHAEPHLPYIGTRKRCGASALKAQCTSGAFCFLAIHMDEPARQRARELANSPEFAKAQRQRKKVKALFAELKNQIGLRRLRLRRLRFVGEQFFLAAAAQNLKRLVRFLSQPTTPTVRWLSALRSGNLRITFIGFSIRLPAARMGGSDGQFGDLRSGYFGYTSFSQGPFKEKSAFWLQVVPSLVLGPIQGMVSVSLATAIQHVKAACMMVRLYRRRDSEQQCESKLVP
jgi:Transposase DDE domain